MLRFLTAGESHGKGLVVIVEGAPAGLEVTTVRLADELARRRLGFGRGPRMRFERDDVTLLAGVRHGRTIGSPIAIEIGNTEWERWKDEMSPDPGATASPLTAPRPGHADLVGMQKYGLSDARDVLERASARETAARVAAGAVARVLLGALGVEVLSHTVALGGVVADGVRPGPGDRAKIDDDEVRCYQPATSALMAEAIRAAAKEGDSLGGISEVLAYGVPVGLGSHVHWDRKLDGLLAQAVMSIQAVKGVEFGSASEQAAGRGSEAHDAIYRDDDAAASAGGFRRGSSKSGGLEGGMTTGSLFVVRATMKPLSTLSRPVLKTVDLATGASAASFKERTDVTAVPAMGVVAEAMVALVLASEALRKFGGDSITETRRNMDAYLVDAAAVLPRGHAG